MKQKNHLFILTVILSILCIPVMAKPVDNATVISAFHEHLDAIPYLNEDNMQTLNEEISEHVKCLQNWSDRDAYIKEHNLQAFLDEKRESLKHYQNSASVIIDDFMLKYAEQGIEDEPACRDSLMTIFKDRTGLCETNLNLLEREMSSEAEESSLGGLNWTLIAVIAAVVIGLIVLISVMNRKPKVVTPTPRQNPSNNHNTPSNPAGIVVRRKTATILKKQSLEDVMENPHYMKVDAIDFCQESAVRRLYIKDTLVIDLYNMYANDLANPNNAKENGCMVLGRWVHDTESGEYYISLEQIVMPGDDAVFQEYELNFGGKIKLSVLEQLRKLRRETGMQYDMTCWIHSHPGLSVFFSNSDLNVQMQLKHPTHPNFLTAIVVDTLTPKEDVGIFTFRRDGNINSKAELTKMYSLKEWYAWAQQSINTPAATPTIEEKKETQDQAQMSVPAPSEASTVTSSDGASYQYSSN